MTTNNAADSTRTDPAGVFITGPTGFGKTKLAREFARGALSSGASLRVLDTVRGALEFQDLKPTYSHGYLHTTIETLQAIFRRTTSDDPVVFVFDELGSALHREDRTFADDEEKLNIDRRNRERDELSDLIADAFVIGSGVGLFPVVVAQSVESTPLIGRIQDATEGWVHFEFTGIGRGVLHAGRDKSPFVLPAAHSGA
ncbi:ATP-binding protein [Curtobacterium citreum]